MKKMLLWICMLFLIVGVASAYDQTKVLFNDSFDRADNPLLGADWTVDDEAGGSINIYNNQMELNDTENADDLKVHHYEKQYDTEIDDLLTWWVDFNQEIGITTLNTFRMYDDDSETRSCINCLIRPNWDTLSCFDGATELNITNITQGKTQIVAFETNVTGKYFNVYVNNTLEGASLDFNDGACTQDFGRIRFSTGNSGIGRFNINETFFYNGSYNDSKEYYFPSSPPPQNVTFQTQPNTTYFNFSGMTSEQVFFDDFYRGWNGTEFENNTVGNGWVESLGAIHTSIEGWKIVQDTIGLYIDDTAIGSRVKTERDFTINPFIPNSDVYVGWNLEEKIYSGCDGADCNLYFTIWNSEGYELCIFRVTPSDGSLNLNGESLVTTFDGDDDFGLKAETDISRCSLYVNGARRKVADYENPTKNIDDGNFTFEIFKQDTLRGMWVIPYFTMNMDERTAYFRGVSVWDNSSVNITVELPTQNLSGFNPTTTYDYSLKESWHNISSSDYIFLSPSQADTSNNLSLNQTWHYQYALFYQGTLTINATLYNGTPILNFTINLTDSNNFSKTKTTKNGTLKFFVNSDTYSATIFPDYYSIETDIVSVMPLQNQNHTFVVYLPNSASLVFKDEKTDNVLVDRNTTYYFWSDTHSFNGSTTTGYANIMLSPNTYRISHTSSGYDQRSYWFTMRNQSHLNLTLYNINSTSGTLITITLEDESTIPLEDWYIKALRQFVNDSSWRVVEIDRTDYEGQTLMNLELYYVPYAFLVEGNLSDGTPFTQYFDATRLKFDTLTLRINTLEDVIGSWARQGTISYVFNHSQTTVNHTVLLIYTDTDNLLEEMCMRVERVYIKNNQVLYDYCSQSSSGTISYTFPASDGSYKAIAYYDTKTEYSSAVLKTLVFDVAEFFRMTGGLGLLMVVLMVATIGALYAFNPTLAVFGAIGGLVMAIALGLSIGATILYSSLIIIGLIIAFKVKS